MDKFTLHQILPERLNIKALAYPLDEHAQRLVIRLHNADLVRIFLNMADKRVPILVVVQIDVIVHGLFLRGIIHRKFRDQYMSAKTVYFLFYCFLKPLHDEKGNDGGGQPDGDADYGNFMDRGGESFLVPAANSVGYEIG